MQKSGDCSDDRILFILQWQASIYANPTPMAVVTCTLPILRALATIGMNLLAPVSLAQPPNDYKCIAETLGKDIRGTVDRTIIERQQTIVKKRMSACQGDRGDEI